MILISIEENIWLGKIIGINMSVIKTTFKSFILEKNQMKFDLLLSKLKDLNLPKGKYAVFGSASLVIHGIIDDVNDFDVIISPSIWNDYKNLKIKDFEFFNHWMNEDVDDLINNHSFLYNDILFINQDKVIKYKKEMKRDKDKDVWSKY
jgi:hypothetical protein